MKNCPKCGSQIPDDVFSCNNCGYQLTQNNNQTSVNYPNQMNMNQNINNNTYPNQMNMNQNIINNVMNKKKIPKYILIILAIVIFLAICAGGYYVYDKFFSGVTRTVMIYMVGSDLETDGECGTIDLNMLDYNLIDNENVKVLVIAGGAKKWHNDYIDVDKTSIYELTENGFKVVKEQEKTNMGLSSTLSNFLNYAYDNYKSDKYDLIMWNHGGGIQGSEYDELYGKDYISLVELNSALENSPFNKDNKMEAVFYRTCLNSLIEIAEIYKDYSDYMIASEEVTMSFGNIGYGPIAFINRIVKNDNAIDVGKKYVEDYRNMILKAKSINSNFNSVYSTYAIIDLNNLDDLVTKFNDFITDIDVIKNYNTIAKVRSTLYQYGGESQNEFGQVDLYNFVYNLKDLSPDKAKDFFDEFDKTIVYNWASNPSSRGLAIYFPYYSAIFLNEYHKYTDLSVYVNFIKKFTDIKQNKNTSSSYSTNKFEFSEKTDETSDFSMELTDEQKETFAKAEYIVFRDDEEKDGYYYPIYRGKQTILDGNTLKASIRGKQIMIVSSDDGTKWPISTVEEDETDEYVQYTTYVVLEDFRDDKFLMDNAKISMLYYKNDKSFKIDYSLLLSNESSDDYIVPDTRMVDYNDYQDIVFASSKYKILDSNGNYITNWGDNSNGIIRGVEEEISTLKLEINDFDDNYNYYCVFAIYDTGNNISFSNVVKMN